MLIPKGKRDLIRFVREITDQCLVSQMDRISRGSMFTNYAMAGSEEPSNAAIFNKTYAYLDDLESLLYSPVSLRFNINDPDIPNVLAEAKGRAASAKLRQLARQSDTDTMISDGVWWSLTKGLSLLKQMWKGDGFAPALVQPESFGVLRENHNKLDSDMEAFCHVQLITPYQLRRMVYMNSDRDEIMKKAKRHIREKQGPLQEADGSQKQVIVGGLYPFQPAGTPNPTATRGIVDWMSRPSPQLSPKQEQELLQLDETWIWDDDREDWATFQMIGDDLMIRGRFSINNAYAYDPATNQENPDLKGKHPFHTICPNRSADYFWGRSEVVNVCLLQEALNSRINGINKILRKQEDPPRVFSGTSGINQSAYAKLNKPGGYYSESNPNAKAQELKPEVGSDLWVSLHEYERLFDEMGGLPPIAKGHGESGVRSQGHAETLVRMFSPRFKDRALLVERDVEGLGASMLDLCKAHVEKKLIAWVDEKLAGAEGSENNPLLIPPAPGQRPVLFTFADLDDDMILTVDSHSSSPAFSEEAKSLVFTLAKIGAMSPEEVLQHVDVPSPEMQIASLKRRQIAAAEQEQQDNMLRLVSSGHKK